MREAVLLKGRCMSRQPTPLLWSSHLQERNECIRLTIE